MRCFIVQWSLRLGKIHNWVPENISTHGGKSSTLSNTNIFTILSLLPDRSLHLKSSIRIDSFFKVRPQFRPVKTTFGPQLCQSGLREVANVCEKSKLNFLRKYMTYPRTNYIFEICEILRFWAFLNETNQILSKKVRFFLLASYWKHTTINSFIITGQKQ